MRGRACGEAPRSAACRPGPEPARTPTDRSARPGHRRPARRSVAAEAPGARSSPPYRRPRPARRAPAGRRGPSSPPRAVVEAAPNQPHVDPHRGYHQATEAEPPERPLRAQMVDQPVEVLAEEAGD